MNPKTPSPVQTAIKIGFVILIIIILIFISFALIKLVPAVFSSISRFKDTLSLLGNKEKISLTLDKKSISNEDNVVLSWKQQRGNAEGEHIFNYPCDALDGETHLELTEMNGDTRSVFCEEDVSLGKAGESDYRKITFTGFSEVDEDQILKLTVSHIGATSSYASSSIPLTIKKTKNTRDVNKETNKDNNEENNKSTTTVSTKESEYTKDNTTETTNTKSKTVTTNSRSSNTSGYRTPTDLGIVFTKSEIRSNDDGIVEFQVINYGQTPSGKWRFRAILPQNEDEVVYNSPYQSSIPGGKASIMTLRFENADSGTVQVVVDYYNEVPESNNNNNTASVRIR